MTKCTQRALRASKPKSATRQRRNETRTSEALKAGKGETGIPVTDTYEPTDVTPEDLFKAWSRKEREALIELLIDTLDAEAGDPDLEETGDAEPSLGFQAGDIFVGRGCEHGGPSDDREVDDSDDEPSIGFDEREHDDADDLNGEEVNEDGDGDPDVEYSLGWHNESAQGGGGWFNPCCADREQCVPVDSAAARQRYKPFDRYNTNRDGMHIDSERGIAADSRRIRNLSDTQRAIVKPRLGHGVYAS